MRRWTKRSLRECWQFFFLFCHLFDWGFEQRALSCHDNDERHFSFDKSKFHSKFIKTDFYPFPSIIHTLPLILITPPDMEIFTIFIFLFLCFFSFSAVCRFRSAGISNGKWKSCRFSYQNDFSNPENSIFFSLISWQKKTLFIDWNFFCFDSIRSGTKPIFQLFTFNQIVSFNGFSNIRF